MGAFASRQVVLLPFPFSDLSANKLRSALILAASGRGDWLLCQITSKPFPILLPLKSVITHRERVGQARKTAKSTPTPAMTEWPITDDPFA